MVVAKTLQEQAYCPTSPTLAHYWIVGAKVETCRHCDWSRPWDVDCIPFAARMTKRAPMKPESKVMRETIMALRLGEEVVIDHSHLVCRLYPSGSIHRCGLQTTLKTLRLDTGRVRDWNYDHDGEEHFATVVRTR
jgi:proteasome lid subunit RPN8/RPN11